MNKAENKVHEIANNERRPYTDEEVETFYNENDKCSGRYSMYEGYQKRLELKDMIVFPINQCPHCSSGNTFQQRMQKKGIKENVFRQEKEISTDGKIRRLEKWDLCLSCQKKFLIEIYIWKLKEK